MLPRRASRSNTQVHSGAAAAQTLCPPEVDLNYFKHCFRVLNVHNMALKNSTQTLNCKFVMLFMFEPGARSDQTISFRDFFPPLRGSEDAG